MDIDNFLQLLVHLLSTCNFVKDININREAFIVKGKVNLMNHRFLQIYFNAYTQTTAFALIENERRIWGIDFDNVRGWHEHPFNNPDMHVKIEQKSIEEIIEKISQVWNA